ncbi:Polysaccharide pyruvyl transferase [Rhodopirellula islandica]|uniref:Polysaccharide pyruvyl transferase n=1 Tax=Rhodopirellula islandica TaxID=595434 RepID=A0A0J1EAG8_RHOIS|nr:polysaccharide pyruvyl transferase family protein [Rhodopirellula islandica]KLU02539.1 Polysaccharide pyruvyl transferase [Rhodopirellula islandica]
MKIALINIFGSYNRGDALLLESLHHSVRSVFGDKAEVSGIAHFPELEQVHFPDVQWNTPPGRSYAENRWLRRAENAINTAGISLYSHIPSSTWPLPLPPMQQRTGVDAIRRSDLVISSAGGFLLDVNVSIYGNLLQLHLAKRFGKPVILAPQTIGPIKSKYLKRLTRHVLSRCDLICAREQPTYDFLTQSLQLNPHQVFRTTDLAFEHDQIDATAGHQALRELGISAGDRLIGASVVDWPFKEEANRQEHRRQYEQKMTHVLETLSKAHDCTVLLVNQVSSDLPLAKRIAQNASQEGASVVADDANRSTGAMRGMINQCDAFLGTRFHSCIFAMLQNVPTTAIAYTHKTTGIMSDLGLSHRSHKIGSFNTQQIIDIVTADISNRDRASDQMKKAREGLNFPKFESILRDFATQHNLTPS